MTGKKPVCGWFITGTDTGIGKTWTTLALMQAFQSKNRRVGGMKPVSSGCEMTQHGLVNADAKLILEQSGANEPYQLINPYAFREPIAPHIAAARAGVRIDIQHILNSYAQLASRYDVMLVEGAGGWRVPLSENSFFPDLVRALNIPVVLVVGLRLGCINHALLTAREILADGLVLAAWVANMIDPEYGETEETLKILRTEIAVPLLGVLPHMTPASDLPADLAVEHLLK